MNNIKMKIYKRVLQEISEKYNEAEDFINKRTEEVCSQEKLSAEEVTYFLVTFLHSIFPC